MDLLEKTNANDNRHPWELSRAENIFRIVADNPRDYVYADIGAGDMFFASRLTEITSGNIYCVDLNFSEEKDHGQVKQLIDVSKIPANTVDCLLLMDVLEHVEDDVSFLRSMLRLVKENGQVIITVPAFQMLFSDHDRFLKHFRRYSLSLLQKKVEANRLSVSSAFYFYSSLFIIRSLQLMLPQRRTLHPPGSDVGAWKYTPEHGITRLIVKILNFDFMVHKFLVQYGVSLFGLSVCMICRKSPALK
jgi:SAM-dependent methyltransferase